MNPKQLPLLTTARQCLARLCDGRDAPAPALELYDSALIKLAAVHQPSDEPFVAGVDLPVNAGRGTLYATAYQAIGALIGFGVPWDDLYPMLADLSEAWGIEQVSSCPECRAEYERIAAEDGGALPSVHYLLYRVARTNLHALAARVPATSLVDYWFVLEILDSLYDPADRVAAESPIIGSKRLQYTTARAALEELAAYGLDERLLEIRDVLDSSWRQDPDHSGILMGGQA